MCPSVHGTVPRRNRPADGSNLERTVHHAARLALSNHVPNGVLGFCGGHGMHGKIYNRVPGGAAGVRSRPGCNAKPPSAYSQPWSRLALINRPSSQKVNVCPGVCMAPHRALLMTHPSDMCPCSRSTVMTVAIAGRITAIRPAFLRGCTNTRRPNSGVLKHGKCKVRVETFRPGWPPCYDS